MNSGPTCPAGTVELCGLSLAPLTRGEVVDRVFAALAQGTGGWIITPNVDHLRTHATDPSFRQLCGEADLIVADGVPLLWAARLQGTPLPERVAGSDLVWLLAERAVREGRSLYLLGGARGAAEGAAQRLRARWPRLRIAGTSCPWVSPMPAPAELEPLKAELVRARPDLVYVGLGAPKQERVIATLRTTLPAAWWIGVGISLSFIAGDVLRAPPWMQRAGLEWVHRLTQEPVRLARRYLLEDLPFAARLLISARRRRGR